MELHLVQRWGDWAGPQPAQSPHRCTKCNSPPINGQCTNFILFDVALYLPLDVVQAREIMKELMDNGPLQGKCIRCYHDSNIRSVFWCVYSTLTLRVRLRTHWRQSRLYRQQSWPFRPGAVLRWGRGGSPPPQMLARPPNILVPTAKINIVKI